MNAQGDVAQRWSRRRAVAMSASAASSATPFACASEAQDRVPPRAARDQKSRRGKRTGIGTEREENGCAPRPHSLGRVPVAWRCGVVSAVSPIPLGGWREVSRDHSTVDSVGRRGRRQERHGQAIEWPARAMCWSLTGEPIPG